MSPFETKIINPHRLRADFPILATKVHDKPLVYLDNAATTQKPQVVIDAISKYYATINANVHRGLHFLADAATQAMEATREKVRELINARAAGEIVFTRNATEALNVVAQSYGHHVLRAGDEILLTQMEHHSNLIPWQIVAKATGARLRFIPITDGGELDTGSLDTLLTSKTKIVSITMMSNVLGTIPPVRQIIEKAHGAGAVVCLDGSQGVPHMPVDVAALDCDFLAFSAHKMCGPTGVGVLYGKEALLDAMPPFMGGGEMIRHVEWETATWNDLPYKFEAGTPNIADIVAFSAAIDYVKGIGLANIKNFEQSLSSYALEILQSMEGVTIYGPLEPDDRGGVVSFNFADIHPHDLAQALDFEGVAIRAGHHCAQPLMRLLGVVATARASFYFYNTKEEIDILAGALQKARTFFHKRVPAGSGSAFG